jgi:two-component system, OmpR family, alkaline phosphatase synthesis response regulator PhoP
MAEQPVILVIDDSEIVLERVKQRLELEGYQVITTMQTVGAARHLRTADLAIIDWHMPGISGGEVLESFRAASETSRKRPPFYLYTSDAEVGSSAKRLGFDGSITNKGDDDSLVQQVAAALRIAKLKARKGKVTKE